VPTCSRWDARSRDIERRDPEAIPRDDGNGTKTVRSMDRALLVRDIHSSSGCWLNDPRQLSRYRMAGSSDFYSDSYLSALAVWFLETRESRDRVQRMRARLVNPKVKRSFLLSTIVIRFESREEEKWLKNRRKLNPARSLSSLLLVENCRHGYERGGDILEGVSRRRFARAISGLSFIHRSSIARSSTNFYF